MRKTLLLMLVAVFALTSCGISINKGSAKDTAHKFAEAYLVKVDLTEMMKYCDKEGEQAMGNEFHQLTEKSEYRKYVKELKKLKLNVAIDENLSKVSERTAIVRFDVLSTAGGKTKVIEPLVLRLTKNESDKWKVTKWERLPI